MKISTGRTAAVSAISVLPIIILLLPMLLSGGNTLFGGDFDMQVQMTEAARISIVEFKQFPFWNPWVAGGVPLFADPQFGLVTPQTLYSFFVHSAYAWKLSILTYFIIGFLSMRMLLVHLTANTPRDAVAATLLSYLWIFGSFFTLRATGGHFTLLLLTLLPLAIYLYLNIMKSKRYFLLLTALLAYCLNAATHFSTLLIFLTLYGIAALTLITVTLKGHHGVPAPPTLLARVRPELHRVSLLIVATVGAVFLNSFRLYQTFEYLRDYSVDRSENYEPFIGVRSGVNALFRPFSTYEIPKFNYGNFEASNYIGTITGLFLIILLIWTSFLIARKKRGLRLQSASSTVLIVFSIVATVSFVVGLAGEPYALIRELPVMSSMRVSTRYLFITSFGLLIIIGILLNLVSRPKVVGKYCFAVSAVSAVILTLSVTQVYYHNFTYQLSLWTNPIYLLESRGTNAASATNPPTSVKNWETATQPEYQGYASTYWSQNHALTHATQNHKVQIIADNALVDTRTVPTQRCDEDEEQECTFILTNNALVAKWSPNKIELERVDPGIIRLNINQSAHWLVNSQYAFQKERVVESDSTFTIADDNEKTYVIEYVPVPSWLK